MANKLKKFLIKGLIVTGTNGKTSVTTMAHKVMLRLGYQVGLIGTIHEYVNNEIINIQKTTVTTPDCLELGKIMSIFQEKKIDIALMEVSSMALKNHRVDACHFDVVAFNNISPEHLDNHKTMENYQNSKLRLFDMAKKAIVNIDDGFSDTVLSRCSGEVLKYGLKRASECNIYASNVEYYTDRVEFDTVYRDEKHRISIKIPSEFAIYNTLAVIDICIMCNFKFNDVANALKEEIPVEGRYDVVSESEDVTAIVDYAHTPVAFENILKSVRMNQAYKRIVTIFGCGGDRDRSKRSKMGKICQTISDYTILTTDNSRTESQDQIFNDILEGLDKEKENYMIIKDREEAINYAVDYAQKGNVIVILGKGHEKKQIMNGYIMEFDDKGIVTKAIRRKMSQ